MSGFFNVWLLTYAMRKKMPQIDYSVIYRHAGSLLSIGLLAGVVAYFSLYAWERYIGHHGVLARIGAVFIPALLSAGSYLGAALWLGLPQAQEIMSFLHLRRGKK
jgi:hypothetical protein